MEKLIEFTRKVRATNNVMMITIPKKMHRLVKEDQKVKVKIYECLDTKQSRLLKIGTVKK